MGSAGLPVPSEEGPRGGKRGRALQTERRLVFLAAGGAKGLPPAWGTLIILRDAIIKEQPRDLWNGRWRVIKPRIARRPNMIDLANGTPYLRANLGELRECSSNHFNARREFATRCWASDHHDANLTHGAIPCIGLRMRSPDYGDVDRASLNALLAFATRYRRWHTGEYRRQYPWCQFAGPRLVPWLAVDW
jgi:hypothetical protein